MIWIILAVVLLSLIAIIAFTQVQISIDTYANRGYVRWGALVDFKLTLNSDTPEVHLSILGWRKRWDLIKLIAQQGRPRKSKDRQETSSKTHSSLQMSKILKLLRSFRIVHFKLEFDTNDYVFNAWLWPVIEFLKYRGADISVNFNGQQGLRFEMSNRPVRMLIALMK